MSVQPILSNLSPGLVKQSLLVLNNAEILTLPTHFPVIITDPGPGKSLIFLSAIGILDVRAGAITNFHEDSKLYFQVGTSQNSSIYSESAGAFADTGSIHILQWSPAAFLAEFEITAAWINETNTLGSMSLKLQNENAGDLEDGNEANKLTLNVLYAILNVNTGLFEV